MMSSHLPATGVSVVKIEVTQVPSSFTPVLPTRTLTKTINGISTTVVAQSFADRIFITITQLNKFGVLYQAITCSNLSSSSYSNDLDLDVESNSPSASNSALPPPLPTTSVTKLVGTEPSPNHTALYQLYVAQIASIIKHQQANPSADQRPLIVSLALESNPSAASNLALNSDVADGGESEDEDDAETALMTSQQERERLVGVMELVSQCRVW